ncbi:hypothetical protein [Burkholderia ambifaria]|uniref:hypothetical protein n=2 Tax=Burkholderia ambifaria TaxID=152480 RepID=UPI0011B200D2|nr:hypothetical protein [Burkholderia ambifaria]
MKFPKLSLNSCTNVENHEESPTSQAQSSRHQGSAPVAMHVSPALADLPRLSPEQRARVGEVYRENRMYHGTSEPSKQSIRQKGFSANRKTTGATAKSFGEDDAAESSDKFFKNARRYNYLTSNHGIASQYALLATDTEKPVIVRALHKLTENDPDAMSAGMAAYSDSYRTKSDISSKYILGPSRQPASEQEAKVFQKLLRKHDLEVSVEHAGLLLRGEQTDSEDEVEKTAVRSLPEERAVLKAQIARNKND